MKKPEYRQYYDLAFKFRVWDNHYNQYVYSWWCLEHLGTLCVPVNSNPSEVRSTLVVERCIGLLDSKSTEVMEGDIMQLGDQLFSVFWDQDVAGFVYDTYPERSGEHRQCAREDIANMHVVGNIHEGVKKKGAEK